MPKVINEDVIAKIAEFARRGYSKSAAGRELNLDRATVRKYWPKEEGAEVEERPQVRLSLEDEFRLITAKKELDWDIAEMLSKIEDRRWETHELRKKGQLASNRLSFLKDKTEKVETLDELNSISNLVKQEQEELNPVLEEDERLRRESLEREEKERQEEIAKGRKGEETLRQYYVSILAWYIPCLKYAESVVRKFVRDHGHEKWAKILGSQVGMVSELKWESNMDELEPLHREFVNIIRGHPEEKDRIRGVMVQRRLRILTNRDRDAIDAFDAWLNFKEDEEFAMGVLKLNGIFKRIADERYIDIDELLKQEASQRKERPRPTKQSS